MRCIAVGPTRSCPVAMPRGLVPPCGLGSGGLRWEPCGHRTSHTPLHTTACSRAPTLAPRCQGAPGGTRSPAACLPRPPRLRRGRSPRPPGTLHALPAGDVHQARRAAPHTPAPAAWCPCPCIPTPCPPAQCDATVGRCTAVWRGSCGVTGVAARGCACPVQGHLSRCITPYTRPPARPPKGQWRSRDCHPMCCTPVPACHQQSGSGNYIPSGVAGPHAQTIHRGPDGERYWPTRGTWYHLARRLCRDSSAPLLP